jgi:hypothetical protein
MIRTRVSMTVPLSFIDVEWLNLLFTRSRFRSMPEQEKEIVPSTMAAC